MKWMPGKMEQVLLNQSYIVKMVDGRIFRRNEHHITIRRQGAKWPKVSTPTLSATPTMSLQLTSKEKLNSILVVINSLIHVYRLSMVRNTRLS